MAGSGTYRTRVTIQDRAGSISATGGITEGTPTNVLTKVPVSIVPQPIAQQGRETVEGGGMRASVTHVIETWYRPEIKARMWVVDGTRTFHIVSVIDVEERHQKTQLLCYEWGT